MATGAGGAGVSTSTTTGAAGKGGGATRVTASADDVGGCSCKLESRRQTPASPWLLLLVCGIGARVRRGRASPRVSP